MKTIKREIEVPKELNDVAVFIAELITDIRAKKSVTELVGENLAGLMAAVDGFDQMKDEVKSEQAYNLYGLLVSDIIKAFTSKPTVK